MEKCEVGDRVVLNSGGPNMTVVAVGDMGCVTCVWMQPGNEIGAHQFAPEMVMAV